MDGMLSQDEINALLSSMSSDSDSSNESTQVMQETLSDAEIDAIGEVSNISMGSAATTLSSLLNQKVTITTPSVSYSTWADVANSYEKPCVLLKISYIEGLSGENVLILKEDDVKIITDLMMGGQGAVSDEPLGELHLSAIAEAMNQMMGTASTSMSSMLNKKIDITPPKVEIVDLQEQDTLNQIFDTNFAKIAFQMRIGDLVDSQIMQLYPIDFCKDLYKFFIESMQPAAPEPQPVVQQPVVQQPQPVAQPQPVMQQMPPMNMNQMPNMAYSQPQPQPLQQVDVSQASFQPFSGSYVSTGQKENIDLIMDVPLEVTVELGRTNKSIKEILEFAPGAILELNKIAGEPVDVLVNGKNVAKGEVVVIEESFGVRITEIVN